MNKEQGILLHIFSGFHIGAEIILPTGKHTLGTSDSCDIILHDQCLASHHLLIDIIEKLQNPNQENQDPVYDVFIEPLEGTCTINQQEIQERTLWQQGDLLTLNSVNIAWVHSTMPNDIKHIYSSLYTINQTDKQIIQENSHSQEPLLPNENIVALPQKEISVKKTKKKNYLAILFSLLLLATLVLTFTPFQNNEFKDIKKIEQYLQENGFHSINVIVTDKGICFHGMLNNDQERAKLYNLAQNMQFPIYLDIIIKEDSIKTIKQTLETKQIYPTITFNNNKIIIGYYVKDALFMQRGYTALKELIPHFADLETKIQEKTIFAQELSVMLNQKKQQHKLNAIQIEYGIGDILIYGIQSKKDKITINTIMAELEQELGFTIPYSIQEKTKTIQTTNTKKERIVKESNKKPYTITSVNTNAIPFVTLNTNEKVFEGGILPDGSLLEKITLKELTINTNGTITTLPLIP